MDRLFVLLLLIILVEKGRCNHKPVEANCASPQYLELEKVGYIKCLFDEFYSVLWYTEPDFNTGYPTIQYQNNVITGPGYESGEFGIQLNGSLIINEVKLRHEEVFTVAYAQSDDDLYDVIKVRVIIVVKPDVPFPFIDQCGEVNDECHGEVLVPNIQCSVRGIRPSISLSLIRRTVYGEEVLSNYTLIISEGVGYTNIVAIDDVFHYSPRLVVLVCKAFSLPGLLEKNESKMLVLNAIVDLKNVKPKLVSVKQNKSLELKCSGKETGIVVWKKANALDYMEQEILVYSVNISKPFSKIIASGFTLGDNLSLLFHSTQVQHEGSYFCMFGDGLRDDLVAYNVTIIILAYPTIDGCNQRQYCVLEAKYEGSLTCAVKGIRPEVQLQWKTFSEGDKTSISFTSQRLTVIENNDAFDITLVSQYQVRRDAHEKITLECEVVASEKDLRGLSKKMDLLLMTGVNQTLPTTSLAIVAIAISLVLVTCGLFIIKLKLRKRTTSTAYVGNMNEMAGMCGHNPPEASTLSDLSTLHQPRIESHAQVLVPERLKVERNQLRICRGGVVDDLVYKSLSFHHTWPVDQCRKRNGSLHQLTARCIR